MLDREVGEELKQERARPRRSRRGSRTPQRSWSTPTGAPAVTMATRGRPPRRLPTAGPSSGGGAGRGRARGSRGSGRSLRGAGQEHVWSGRRDPSRGTRAKAAPRPSCPAGPPQPPPWAVSSGGAALAGLRAPTGCGRWGRRPPGVAQPGVGEARAAPGCCGGRGSGASAGAPPAVRPCPGRLRGPGPGGPGFALARWRGAEDGEGKPLVLGAGS